MTRHNGFLTERSYGERQQKKIWVFIGLDPMWMLADVLLDVALIVSVLGKLKAVLMVAELPEALVTLADLFQLMKIVVGLIGLSYTLSKRPADAVLSIVEAFKKISIGINVGDAPNIKDTSFLNYANADGIAALLGAKTLNVMVMSDDGHQLAYFDSGPDDSWIATSHEKIVRSKYGSLWEEDSSAGQVNWPAPPAPASKCRCRLKCRSASGPRGCCCGGDDCECI